MQDISESIDASSWPYGYEWEIESWVAGGNPDRSAFGDHVLFERLSMLHAKLGAGYTSVMITISSLRILLSFGRPGAGSTENTLKAFKGRKSATKPQCSS
jgi:hypothetical protein